MSYLETNLQVLKGKFPKLHEIVSEGENKPYEKEISRSGYPTIKIDDQYIHSRFDPQREAERFINSKQTEEAGLYILGGFGLGYHAQALFEITNSETILIIEPDLNLFKHALCERDITDLLYSDRVIFLIGGQPDDCLIVLEQHPGKLVQLITIRSLYELNTEFYSNVESSVRNYISRKEVNLSTLKRFGRLWVRNLSENAHLLSSTPGVSQLEGLFSGIPALLVAAGPSLDKVKSCLKELREKYLIVAVDTALRTCLDQGVDPDFTVLVDPQYWNTRHLDNCLTDRTILLSDTSTYPSVFRILTGKSFLCSSSFPLGLYMEKETEVKGKLKAGGSVATAAWDFCRILGCDTILCAGLDLGFPDKQTHCRGSFFEQRAHWISNRNLPVENLSWHALIDAGLELTQSNKGGRTWTDKRMNLYIRWFEDQMTRHPSIESWNLSDGGVRIRGMQGKDLTEALGADPIRPKIDSLIEKARSIHTDEILHSKLRQAHISLLEEFRELKELSREGLETAINLKKNFMSNSDITPFVQALNRVDSSIISRSGREIAGFVLLNFTTEILKDKGNPEADEIIENSIELYRELNNSLTFHSELLEKSLKKLKNTQV